MRRLLLAAMVLAGGLAVFWVTRPVGLPQDIPLAEALLEGPLRMVAFGTSLTSPPQVWPDRLGIALAECRGAAVTVARVAGPGQGSGWAREQIGRVAVQAPDLVLLEFAINDADLSDGLWPWDSRANHRRLLAELREALPRTRLVMLSMNPAQGPRGWVRPFLAPYYAAARDEAAWVAFADLYPRWLALPSAARGLQEDGLHPDPGIAAGVIVAPLLALIAPECPG